MKPKLITFMALLIPVMLNAGCAGVGERVSRYTALSDQERYMVSAVDQIRLGNEQRAQALLEKVVSGVPTIGVTDEALFRLALLSLKDDGGKGLLRAQALLEQLSDKYPDSIWTRQSAPLLLHLAEAKVLRNRLRELKALKEHNLSLSRDNKDMRQSLEQLKQLDLELEKRIKR
ncbi:MAG: tetratricopeptide repeat protein [Desulfuromonadaceae bacterium]|nr:tetratricopeptide repeat protein [Desulfuromonadaceae bacterium]